MKIFGIKNVPLRLFALLVAILLFVFVNDESNMSTVDIAVPLEVRNLPNDKVLISPKVRQVRVSIKGPTSLVTRIGNSPPILKIKIPDGVEKRYAVLLKPQMLSLPAYVQVQKIEPSEMELTFDSLVMRKVPVEIPKIGTVPSGFKVEGFLATPGEVTVRGPETEVREIKSVETFPVDLRDIRESFVRELTLKTPGDMSSVEPATVSVKAQVFTVTKTFELKDLPIEFRASGTTKEVVLTPDKISIVISGPVGDIDRLTRDDIVPYIRVRDIPPSGVLVPVKVDLPAPYAVNKMEPDGVMVTLPPIPSPSSGAVKVTKRTERVQGKK